MRTTLEQRKKHYRIIYELLFEDPRIHKNTLSSILGGGRTAGLRMREAFDQQYIVGPEIRLRSFENLKEYIYLIRCRHPELPYLKYREDMNVAYHAKTIGFCDLWIISKKKLDVEGEIVHEGYHSDFYVSYAPDRSWEESLEITKRKIDEFNPKEYEPTFFVKEHFGETADWTEEDDCLYRYFKYNLRKPLTPVLRDLKISRDTLNNFFQKLPEYCTIFTDYFPDGLPSYDPYLFMVETDYEDFVIDLFSQLPTSASFFKVSEKLCVFINIPEQVIRGTDLHVTLNKLYIPLLFIDMLKKKIIIDKDDVLVDYSMGKSL